MNLAAARVVLRPRPLADLLDLTAPFCRVNSRVLLRLSFFLLLPALLVLFALWRLGVRPRLVWGAAACLADFLEGPFTLAVGELLFTGSGLPAVRTRQVLSRFVSRLPAYLGGYLLSRLLLLLALATVVGWPSVAVRFLFVREALLLEGASPLTALRRSARLGRRQVRSCLGLGLALLALPLLAVAGGDLLGNAVVHLGLQLGQPFGDLDREGISGYALVGLLATVPLAAAARFLKYIDIRTRKEGWDVQLRFMALANPALETDAP